jgi:iron complex outermembrane recepter protein
MTMQQSFHLPFVFQASIGRRRIGIFSQRNARQALPRVTVVLFCLSCFSGFAQSTNQLPSLEELMKTQISSVSRKDKQLLDTPAAVYVVTREDIRSSGARTIPDALRLVPGMDVAQINASMFDVGIRGFDERFSNKMLVMVDGRSLYSPLFGGIYWDSLDLVMEDIERIEVIRGPGGSLWGTNAVNGTVNIITRSSQSTQGALLIEQPFSDAPATLTARYGGQVGRIGAYRVFAQYTDAFGNQDMTGHWAGDAWHLLHQGFRMDLKPRGPDALMLEGDLYEGSFGEPLTEILLTPPFSATVGGINSVLDGDMLARWTHSYANGEETQLQIYTAEENRNATERPDNLTTVDADLQHHFRLGSRQDLVGGAGYRYSHVGAPPTPFLTITPAHQTYPLFSAFLQDEIALLPKRLSLTVGAKTEHNRFTGFDLQPSARLNWRPSEKSAVWAAVSQAVKIPNILNTSMYRTWSTGLGSNGLDVTTLIGNPRYRDEHLLAWESGYRLQFKSASVDATGFVNRYNDVETNESLAPVPQSGYTEYPLQWANNLYGESFGAEGVLNWNATARWHLSATYAWLKLEMRANAQSNDTSTAVGFNTGTPANHFGARSSYSLLKNLEFNALALYTGPLPSGLGADTPPALSSYCRVDSNLQWRVGEYLRLDIGGQNLLDPRIAEYTGGNGATETLTPRNLFGRIRYVF